MTKPKATHSNGHLMGIMAKLYRQIVEAQKERSVWKLRRAWQEARNFSQKHSVASTFFSKYGDEGEEENKNRESVEEDVPDRMDIDKCDPTLEKLAKAILCKRDLAVEHVWMLWNKPANARQMGAAARIAHKQC